MLENVPYGRKKGPFFHKQGLTEHMRGCGGNKKSKVYCPGRNCNRGYTTERSSVNHPMWDHEKGNPGKGRVVSPCVVDTTFTLCRACHLPEYAEKCVCLEADQNRPLPEEGELLQINPELKGLLVPQSIVDAQGPTPATPSKTHYSVGVNGVLKRTRDKKVGFCRAFYAPQPDIDITDDEEVEDEDEE